MSGSCSVVKRRSIQSSRKVRVDIGKANNSCLRIHISPKSRGLAVESKGGGVKGL